MTPSLASSFEGDADRVYEQHRRHDVPQGAKVLPHERQKMLDRFSHRPRRNIGLVRNFQIGVK